MDKVKLAAKSRDVFGRKTKKGKEEGMIPAVIYGHGIEAKSLWISNVDFLKMIKKSGESTIIELNIDKDKNPHNVIIHETQKDPVSGNFIHADFFKIKMDEAIEVEVELEYIGESPAVKELGGVLVKNIDEVTVKCLPAYLPSKIEVDISSLKTFEDHICIKDLKISDKVTLSADPETVVALVSQPRSEAELSELSEKVEADVTKVEGVVKPEASEEGDKKNDKEKEVSK